MAMWPPSHNYAHAALLHGPHRVARATFHAANIVFA